MSFQDLLEKHENSQGTPAAEEVNGNPAESANDQTPADAVVTPEAPTEVKETETPVTSTETPVVQPDINKILEESSEGLFKSVDDLKLHLPKIKEYDTLKQQRDEFEAKTKEDPFASPFIKKYNDLLKANKTQEQIKSFVKINQLGDLSQLSPFDVKVESMIQDGYARETAERKVRKEFGLDIEISGEHLTPEEIERNKQQLADNEEDLRVSSQKDLEKLQDLKVKLEDTTDNVANNKALAEQAQTKEYNEKLQPIVKKIATEYAGLGSLNVNGKNGEESKVMSFDADPEYKAEVEQIVYDHFKDGKIPVNEQTVAKVKDFLDAGLFMRNKERFVQTAYNQGYADAKEASDNEFENKSGLPVSGQPPITATAATSLKEQQLRAARGEDD